MVRPGRTPQIAVIAALLGATACSPSGAALDTTEPSGEVTSSEADRPGAFDVDAYQQELVACYEDHGVDAQANPDGSVSSDSQGAMGRQESLELNAICEQRLVEAGIIDLSPPSAEDLRRAHAGFVELRQCLTDAGFEVPDLPSAQAFISDPTVLEHPMETVFSAYGPNGLQRARQACEGVGRR